MGPRRMDGFGGRPPAPAGTRPVAARPQRPTQQPVARPASRPAAQAQVRQSQPVRRSAPPVAAQQPVPARRAAPELDVEPVAGPQKSGGGIGIVLQFVIGLLVIVGVAAAVVWLWIKYYQS